MAETMRLQPILTKGTFKGKTWVSKPVARKLRAHKCKVGEFTHKPPGGKGLPLLLRLARGRPQGERRPHGDQAGINRYFG